MWRLNACLRLKPFAVALKRLAAPRRVFNLAIVTSFEHLFGAFAPLQIEKDLHQTICNVSTFNEKMGNILIHAQSSILISQLLHQAIHVNDYHLMLNEHAQVFEALFYGSVNDAAQALEKHIQSAQKRSVDYLKVFSIIPEPHIAPYLERLT